MTSKMQLCGTIYCSMTALHVSSDIIAHHEELLNCHFTASGNTYVRHRLPVSWENQKSQFWLSHDIDRQWRTYVLPEAVKIQFISSWWWAIILLETCRTIKGQ